MSIRARATRVGGWWAVEAEHAGHAVFTQARRLDQVENVVRGAFGSLGLDVEAEAVEVVRMKKAPEPLLDVLVDASGAEEERAAPGGEAS